MAFRKKLSKGRRGRIDQNVFVRQLLLLNVVPLVVKEELPLINFLPIPTELYIPHLIKDFFYSVCGGRVRWSVKLNSRRALFRSSPFFISTTILRLVSEPD